MSPELLRAWERRYGLLRPTRSAGGLRLYSPDDLERVRLMQAHLDAGLAAAQAAALASREPDAERSGTSPPRRPSATELAEALGRFDEPRAQAVLDGALAVATVDALLADVVLPYLHELGERWARGEASVAQEHFASSVLRGRLLGLARGWGNGLGPLALLACLPGEQHEFGLIAFGLALRSRGWRVAYLGQRHPARDDRGRGEHARTGAGRPQRRRRRARHRRRPASPRTRNARTASRSAARARRTAAHRTGPLSLRAILLWRLTDVTAVAAR